MSREKDSNCYIIGKSGDLQYIGNGKVSSSKRRPTPQLYVAFVNGQKYYKIRALDQSGAVMMVKKLLNAPEMRMGENKPTETDKPPAPGKHNLTTNVVEIGKKEADILIKKYTKLGWESRLIEIKQTEDVIEKEPGAIKGISIIP